MRFFICGNTYKTDKSAKIAGIISQFEHKNAEYVVDTRFASFLADELGLAISPARIAGFNECSGIDIIASIGGDGTFLRAAQTAGCSGIPVLGVNTGRMGFLTDVSPENFGDALDCILSGKARIEERSLLHMHDSPLDEIYPFALNDIAILKRDTSSMISIKAFVNEEYLTTYQADGIVVATPTGSTAYSLSAGGPVIMPQTNTIVITPVAPHSLNMRPIVLCDSWDIRLEVCGRNHRFMVSVDGHCSPCDDYCSINISKADYTVKIVRLPGHTLFDNLRSKFMWGFDGRGEEL